MTLPVEWWGLDGTDFVHKLGNTEIERRPATSEELAAQSQAQAVAQAQAGIASIYDQSDALQTQLQADITAVQAGWDALTADQRTAIMGRILNGFSTVMSGLTDHAKLTGAIPAA